MIAILTGTPYYTPDLRHYLVLNQGNIFTTKNQLKIEALTQDRTKVIKCLK